MDSGQGPCQTLGEVSLLREGLCTRRVERLHLRNGEARPVKLTHLLGSFALRFSLSYLVKSVEGS